MTAQTLPNNRIPNKQEPLYSISEAAKLLGVSPSTLRRWEDEGRLVPARTSGGNHRRYSQDNVKRLLKSFRKETDQRLNAGGRLPPKTPTPSLEKIQQPAPRRKRFSHRLADLTLLLIFLAIIYVIVTPLSQERLEQAFAGPLQNLIYSAVRIVSPQKAELIKPGVPDPIIDVNDTFEYVGITDQEGEGETGLRAKLTLIGSEMITQTLRVVKNGVFNTTQLLGTLFFGKGDEYYITPAADASLYSLKLEDALEANSVITSSLVADTLDADLDWENLTNRPPVVSSVDGVINDEGNIDLVAGSNITITPNDPPNTITFDVSGGSGSELDADLLDSLDSSQFLRSDTSDNFTSGTLTFDAGTTLNLSGAALTLTDNQIGWAKVSKSGSSLADLETRSILATTGTLTVARGGTGATTLTGMLKGNGAAALSGVTGTANYATYWFDANTIAAEQYLAITRGGTGAGTLNDLITLGTHTTGNYVAGATANGGLTMTGGEGGTLGILLPSATDGLSATTSSGSGLELLPQGLTLLQGCDDGYLLKWDETNDYWYCAIDAGGGGGNSFETMNAPAGTDPVAESATDTLNLTVTGINLTITGNAGTDTLTFDIDESVLAGGGITVSGDALQVNTGSGIQVAADAVALGPLAADWDQTGAFDVVLNNASSELKILESAGATFYGILDVGDLSVSDQTYTFTTGGTVWTSGNDGATSGLDADLLDGQEGSYYTNATNINAGTLGTGYYSAYGDLTAEGYLDNDAGGDLLTRSQSDGRHLAFRTFDVPAGSDPVADLYNDTLTFTAGSNVTITGNSTTDTITITATGLDNYQSWTAADHDDDFYTVTSLDTLKFAEGTGIDVDFSGDDLLTISHLTTDGYKHVPSGGASAQILQYSAAGTAKWITVSSDITIADGGAVTIANDAVALGADTTNDYVASITDGSGISGGDGGSEGATLTLSLGALTADWDQTGAFDIILNNADSQLQILENDGTPTLYGIFDVADLTTASKTYTFPDATGDVLLKQQIDTFSELNTVVADQTLIHSGVTSLSSLTTVGTLTSGNADAIISLGTAIDTTEITDDTIAEADLDVITDTAVDEDILTYESGAGGDFEWHTGAELGIGTATSITDDLIVAADFANEDWGDVSITSSVAYVEDLTISGETQGDVLYFNGANWVRLAADAGKYLKSGAAAVSWDTPAGAGDVTDVGDCSTGACFTADGAGNNLYFEGSSPDAFETILTSADITVSDKTFTFPDDEIADNDLIVGTGAGTFGYTAIPDCDDPSHLNYDVTAGTFSCGTTDDDVPEAGDYSALTGGTGIGHAVTGTLTFDAAELSSLTFGAGGDASVTWTYSLSGATDPVWTIGDNSMDLTTGVLKVGGTAVLTSETGDVSAVGDCSTGACFTADGAGNNLYFEGSSADAVEAILTVEDPTSSDSTFTIPDGAGSNYYIVVDATKVTDIEGTGLAIAGTTLNIDQSTAFAWTGQQTWTKTIANTGALGDFNITLGNDGDIDTIAGVQIDATSANTGEADILYGLNIASLTSADAAVNEHAIYVGANWDQVLNINGTLLSATELGYLDGHDAALVDVNDAVATAITGTGALNAGSITAGFGAIDVGASSITTTGTIGTASTTTFTGDTGTFSGAIAANGGITFDNSTDTVGAHTAAGTYDMNTNILTNIGNTGTDFVAATGALNLAGALTMAADQDITFTSGTGSLIMTNSISNASEQVIDLAPAFAGGAADGLTYTVIDIAAFAPTNAAGTDTVTGFSIGNLTDPGAAIASQALNIGSGWDVGLYIADADTYSLQLASTHGDPASGITFGADTNLYRSAADTLKTDDNFVVGIDLTVSGGNVLTSGNLALKPDNDTDDYIYLDTTSNEEYLYFEDASLAYSNDPGVRLNSSGGRIEYRDQNESSWTSLDSIAPGIEVGARVKLTANESIPNNTVTAIPWDAEDFDTDDIWTSSSSTRLTAKTAGKYLIVADAQWDQVAAGRRRLTIRLNGTTNIAAEEIGSAAEAGYYPTHSAAVIYDLSVNDYVEATAYQSSGGALNIEINTTGFMMMKIGGGGGGGGGTEIGTRVYRSTDQSIPNATWTMTSFDNERYDTDNIWAIGDPTKLICRTAGKYLIIAQGQFDHNNNGERYGHMYLNGATTIARFEGAGSDFGTRPWTFNLSTIWEMAVDDFVQVRVYQDSGAGLNIRSSAASTPEFMMIRVGAAGGGGLWSDAGTYIYPNTIGSSWQLTDTGDLLVTGDVGIGTASLGRKLVVDVGATQDGIDIVGTNAPEFRLGDTGGTAFSNMIYIASDQTLRFGTSQSWDVLTIKNGDVGIGKTSPQTLLHVGANDVYASYWFDTATEEGLIIAPNINSAALAIEGNTGAGLALVDRGAGVDQKIFDIRRDGLLTSFRAVNDAGTGVPYTFFTLEHNTGDVGIGVTPEYRLDVNGDVNIRGNDLHMGGGDWSIAYSSLLPNHGIFYDEGVTDKIVLSPDGGGKTGSAFVVDGNSDVSIGGDLTVSGDDIKFSSANYKIDAGTSTSNMLRLYSAVHVGVEIPTIEGTIRGFMVQSNDNDESDAVDSIRVTRDADGVADKEFRVTWSGKAYADGGWQGAADYAEYFYTGDATIDRGDLVALTTKPSSVIPGGIEKANRANLNRLGGVISTKPGFVGALGADTTDAAEEYENNPHYKLVGLLGQAPAKVSTVNGPIEIGDPITSSDIPGAGMKATKAGPIAGRALEPYDNPDPNTVGKILVFINAGWYDPGALVDSDGDMAQVNPDGTTTKIIAQTVEAEEGIFEKITATISAIFNKITAKTAEIAEAVIQTLRVEKAEIKTLEVEALNTGEGSDIAGSGVVKEGEGSVTIESLAVTERSKIYVTFTTDYAPATRFWVAEKKPGESFTVELDAPVAADANFDWWIVN